MFLFFAVKRARTPSSWLRSNRGLAAALCGWVICTSEKKNLQQETWGGFYFGENHWVSDSPATVVVRPLDFPADWVMITLAILAGTTGWQCWLAFLFFLLQGFDLWPLCSLVKASLTLTGEGKQHWKTQDANHILYVLVFIFDFLMLFTMWKTFFIKYLKTNIHFILLFSIAQCQLMWS